MTNVKPLGRLSMAEARAILPELEASGLSIQAFARERGLQTWALYKVARDARTVARPKRSSLAEVLVVPPPQRHRGSASSTTLEVTLSSGLAVRVPREFDDVTLRRLLGVLRSC
ncbi:MAG: hypothetical protein R3F49_05740 [Planctomycetota bacterium]